MACNPADCMGCLLPGLQLLYFHCRLQCSPVQQFRLDLCCLLGLRTAVWQWHTRQACDPRWIPPSQSMQL